MSIVLGFVDEPPNTASILNSSSKSFVSSLNIANCFIKSSSSPPSLSLVASSTSVALATSNSRSSCRNNRARHNSSELSGATTRSCCNPGSRHSLKSFNVAMEASSPTLAFSAPSSSSFANGENLVAVAIKLFPSGKISSFTAKLPSDSVTVAPTKYEIRLNSRLVSSLSNNAFKFSSDVCSSPKSASS